MPVLAASSSSDSNATTVDTQDSLVTVSGRLLDSATGLGLDGVIVTLGGQTTTTANGGRYTFNNVSLAAGSTVTATRAGQVIHNAAVQPPAGARQVLAPDARVAPTTTAGKPVVTSLSAKYDGIFPAGLHVNNELTANVNWNGGTPGPVSFYANNTLIATVSGAGPSYVCPADMAGYFAPSFRPGANRVSAVARNAAGTDSTAVSHAVLVIPLPGALQSQASQFAVLDDASELHLAAAFHFPEPKLSQVVTLPVIGKFGLDFAMEASFDYDVLNGTYDATFGLDTSGDQGKRGRRARIPGLTQSPTLKLYIGNKEIAGSLLGGLRGTATPTTGITLSEVYGHASISAKLELGRVGLPDLLGPGLSSTVSALPGMGEIMKTVAVLLYVKPEVSGDVSFAWEPKLDFKNFELQGTVGLEAAYEPHLGPVELRLYVGGEPSVTFQYPGSLIKELRFMAYAGGEMRAWAFSFDLPKYVFVNFSIAGGKQVPAVSSVLRAVPLAATGNSSGPRPMERSYLQNGPERFVVNDPVRRVVMSDGAALTPLEAFRALGQGGGKKGVIGAAAGQGKNVRAQTPQANLPLLQNVFPEASPALAGRGQELMLLYVTDNGQPNSLQFTDINWTRFDGVNWSAPAALQTDTRAEFAPQVAYDGAGDALAVWQRVAATDFNTTNLTAMAAQMEIVWSRWSRAAGTWAVPVALTTNTVLDQTPLLCGPMTNGDLLLTWTRNPANLLLGTGAVGAVENSSVLWSRWNATAKTWTPEQTLVANLPYRLSQSLAGVSNRAVYAWSQDLDGVLTNANDQQIFYCLWADGAWSAPTQFTRDTNGNNNVRAAVSTNVAPGWLLEGFESGDFSRLGWSSAGTAAWTVQNSVVSNGTFAAASGTIGDGQSSSLLVTQVCVAGSVSFAYRVSSESGYDYLTFLVNGQQQSRWSGTVGWTNYAATVAAGTNVFEWRYSKDGSVSSGSDKAWIDDVRFPVLGGQEVFLVWQQGTNLVLNRNFTATNSSVRFNSQTAGFADFALTIGPAGNLALLWQEMSQDGSDPYYAIYDPTSASWSQDARLFADPSLERSFAPVWDDVGNLTVAYNKVDIFKTNKTVTLTGGGTLTITNVPQPGRVDLAVVKRALVKDVALLPGDFTVAGANYLPGDAVTLTATLRNLGDVAVNNVAVGFYDGNPAAGGTLLTNVTVPGWLIGASNAAVTALWIVPDPAQSHTLYAVADPANVVAEFNEGNNTQTVSLGGTDLAVALVSATVETNGVMRVITQVQNVGSPTAIASVLAIRRNGQPTATPLATGAVPALEPGRLAQVALDLPAGTIAEGDGFYVLSADDTRVTGDVNTNNNVASFAVNLFLDSDGDGIPDAWEIAHGLDPHNPNDARLDNDGDGLSNLAEYLAGTDPNDRNSYLKIQSVGLGAGNNFSGGIQLNWGSSSNRLYSLERSTELRSGFVPAVQHVLATPPQNAFLDTTATNAGPYFYRIRVE